MTATAECSAHAPGRAERVRVFLILGALSAIGPLSIDMYLPALPGLTRDLSASASLVQLTLTACLVGLAAGQLLAGPISDMWGRRRPMFAGAVIYTLASLACAVAPDVRLLIALRLIQGVAGAACIVISRAVVRDLHDGPAAARFFALLMLVNGVAPVAAPVIGGQVLRVTSWSGVFVVLTVLGLLMTLSVFGLRETLRPADRHTGGLRAALRTYRELCSDRVYMGYALAGGLAFAAMFAYISGAPFVVENIYGMSPQAFSLVFAVNSLGIVALGQVSGMLAGRVRLMTLLRAGLAVSSLGGALLVVAVFGGLGLWGRAARAVPGGVGDRADDAQLRRPRAVRPAGQHRGKRLGAVRPDPVRHRRRRRASGRCRGFALGRSHGPGHRRLRARRGSRARRHDARPPEPRGDDLPGGSGINRSADGLISPGPTRTADPREGCRGRCS